MSLGDDMRAWLRDLVQPQKNPLTLEHLQQLSTDLQKHVEQSKPEAVVEDVRQITELMIWGDRHNPAFFDYFLEKNILGQILELLAMPHTPKAVKLQIIQTLSMLLNNITNDTAVYYILSNNHTNELICHEFDFNDNDYMAYWISFVKGLALRLNEHTVQFFFNNSKQTFPLLTEAIRHFKHSESMVRIAVRTLTLKVFSVTDPTMRKFVLQHSSTQYFPALISFIADYTRNMATTAAKATSASHSMLDQQCEELIDMLYYVADIYNVDFQELTEKLTDTIRELLITPLLEASLPGLSSRLANPIEAPRMGADVVYYVLAQFFVAISHAPVISSTTLQLLAPALESEIPMDPEGLFGGEALSGGGAASEMAPVRQNPHREAFFAHLDDKDEEYALAALCLLHIIITHKALSHRTLADVDILPRKHYNEAMQLNILTRSISEDSESLLPPALGRPPSRDDGAAKAQAAAATIEALSEGDEEERDEEAASSSAMEMTPCKGERPKELGADHDTEAEVGKGGIFEPYAEGVIERILGLLQRYPTCRLITLHVAARILLQLVEPRSGIEVAYPLLTPRQMKLVARAYTLSQAYLRNRALGANSELFLDMFEDECATASQSEARLHVGQLAQSSFLVLPIVQGQVVGIDLARRVPSTDLEHTRKAIQVFLLVRRLVFTLEGRDDDALPLQQVETPLREGKLIDLTDSDVIACGVKTQQGQRPVSRYLMVDQAKAFMVLVEPDQTKIGWAAVRAVHPLMHVEAKPTRNDNRVLQVAVRTSRTSQEVMHLVFDDHIRCLAARQHLDRGRAHTRAGMMEQINGILKIGEEKGSPPVPQEPTEGDVDGKPEVERML